MGAGRQASWEQWPMELELPTTTPAQTTPPKTPKLPSPLLPGNHPHPHPHPPHHPQTPPIPGTSMPLSSPLGRVNWKGGAKREEVTQSRTGQDQTQFSIPPNLKDPPPISASLEHPSFPPFPSPTPFINIYPETGTEARHPGSSPSPLSPLDARV